MREQEQFNIFLADTAAIFQGKAKDVIKLRASLTQYIIFGLKNGYSQGELLDFLGVSSPSILEMAGYTDIEQDRAMTLLGTLTDEELKIDSSS